MNRNQALLIRLMEECAEVSQRASKVLNFGWEEQQEGHGQNNLQRLAGELNDLVAIVRMIPQLTEEVWDAEEQEAKMAKVEHYLEYSRTLGILTDN